MEHYTSGNDKLEVLKPGSDTRREHISDEENEIFKYKLVHSTPKSGVRYKYANKMIDKDYFGIPKIIIGETGLTDNIVIDEEGKFGMTACCFGIKIKDKKEGEKIKNIFVGKDFQTFIKSANWGNYRIDWRLFTHVKKF